MKLREALRPYHDGFAAWMTPARFVALFVALWAVLIALAVITGSLVPIALGLVAWWVPKIAGWGSRER